MELLKNLLTSLTRATIQEPQVYFEEQRHLIRPAEVMKRFDVYLKEQPAIYLPVRSTNKPFSFREGVYDDINHYLDLEERAYHGVLAWGLKDFVSDYRTNPYRMYILLTWEDLETGEEVIAGMISGRFLARKAHISHLIVDPKFQAKGVGRKLLQVWIEMMQEQNIPYCDLEVRVSNDVAIRLYESVDFRKQARIGRYYNDNHEDAWKMRRVNDKH
ncbi:ribosomal protein S18-alanine N-acetyltransferase [Aerococcaceae bacterium DSM 111176]|nr:ribosomal protein S18-alanine N-acetyltransferase [Aerococcaceae bacterium DSM 111176]